MSQDYVPQFGWRSDGGHELLASEFPRLRECARRLLYFDEQDGKPVLLYRAFLDVLGSYPAYPAQEIGDCVGFGHGHGVDLLQCVEIALGEPAEFRETDTEFIYAASREAAGILGRQDGSYGSAAVKAMTTIGIVSREMLGMAGAYSGARAKQWGRYGVPESAKQQAAAFKLGSAANVRTWAELVAAVRNGYPVSICSDQGFSLERDAQGFCPPKGNWGHCMVIAGVRFDRPGACILQSWGPDTPTGPLCPDQPPFSFWADQAVVERMLAQGDSWALTKAPDFVVRKMPPRWSYSVAA